MKKLLAVILFAMSLIPMHVEAKSIDMGEFKITAYCPCYMCSEGYGRKTSSGAYARSSHTIAVDPSVIGYGARVRIGDDDTYVAEDCGGGVSGDHIDIFFDTHEEVEEFGVKYRNVWIVKGEWDYES